MHPINLQQAPAPTAGPSQAALNHRLGLRANAPATCGWITGAEAGCESSELFTTDC
jgi:hypothetical protein